MLYDLNVPWIPSQPPAHLERTISFLSTLGYNTLAINHTHSGPLPSQVICAIPSTQPFPLPKNTTLLRRCTLVFSDPSQNYRMSTLAAAYDIFALRPTNEKAYLAACTTLTEHSLISLDLTQRYPFHWKPKPLMTAVNRGVRIEICYAQASEGGSEARRNFISNAMAVVRATKGRGLVISSEAQSVLGCRAPADVVNLLGVWGLARERGAESMGVTSREVVVNEGVKRRSFRGVVEVIDGGENELAKVDAEGKGKGKGGKAREENGNAQKGNKRKVEETNADGTPMLSKRAMKRAKLASKAAVSSENLSSNSADTPVHESATPSTTKPIPKVKS
ncbi:RNase P subunit p30 [Drepanopeziza brunnea f. sp. 'multigermtubi' MB_m1]|uniref:RNase P subunit p30 n=1 Tax=Marssonina brunnea f. sp. multigermtubi (strain MB_m1) TaxID=1072389 RepID=K1XZ30_MARBU|nr:RNase P subunit p30 [Drepanopeziza brunnea f. sp. 'multigermtubi' MB_m1]EKD18079.1 RNase P subunit p30 [Drepanopeziza brunnea f. sp. 'multigermtubi' MB_m1]